mmetsp:Transcript_31770/g.83028  ORF Transcript_31770/g.83028 Transcript_31770/m.83028 type:complete len:272 (+) Transcript_31770:66-881(+)
MSVFPGQSVRDRANHVIFRATPLFRTATPSRLRHSLVRIARSTQRESLQPSPSGPEVAHPARCKMASKPSRQPPRGESRKSSLRRVNNADQVALSHSMEHGSGLHHAKVKELLPRAAIHLQPPGADGSLQTCLETVSQIRSHRSAKVARRVRACSNHILGRTRIAHRAGSDWVASTSTRDGRWRCCRLVLRWMYLPSSSALRDSSALFSAACTHSVKCVCAAVQRDRSLLHHREFARYIRLIGSVRMARGLANFPSDPLLKLSDLSICAIS